MQCLLLLSLLFLPAVYSTVTLETQRTASVSVPTNVSWTREDGDPTLFDLRFLHRQHDFGLAGTVNATDGELSGMIPVTFPTQGRFVLAAVDFEHDNQDIAFSGGIVVDAGIPTIPVSATSTSSQPTPPTASTVIVTTIIPSSTGSSSPSATAGATNTPSNAASKSGVNTTAIVGGVLGGVILVLIVTILFVLAKRKSAKKRRRLTFKRDLMVQHRPPIAPDIEEGRGIGTSPILPPLNFPLPITALTPQVPTRSQFPASALHTPVPVPVPTHAPTHRQVQLGTRIVQVENQMASIRRQNRGQEGMETVLGHMKRQVEWLRAERDSPWARCETDVPPPRLDYYME